MVDEADPLRVTVVQDGARLHYALPLGLAMAGILGTMHTDWFVRPNSLQAVFAKALSRSGSATGRRLAGRRCSGLEHSRVVASGWSSLLARLREDPAALPEDAFVRRSQAISRQVFVDGWRHALALAGFVRNIDPALCEAARKDGLAVVLDQMIAPIPVQMREEQRQGDLWPEWREASNRGAEIMRKVEQRSWAAANHITCASDYVRDGLLAEGIERERISVIPYPVDASAFSFCDRRHKQGPVVVGFLGAISLRKGAPAFLEIAKAFDPRVVRFVMVGPMAVSPALIARHRGAVDIVGAVPRAEVGGWLERFDLLLFPSACEGSAVAVVEAMATGLPIVTTPNSGTPVRDGVEGFVVGCEDIGTMIRRVGELVANKTLRFAMGRAGRRRVEALTVRHYGRAWHDLLKRVLAAEP